MGKYKRQFLIVVVLVGVAALAAYLAANNAFNRLHAAKAVRTTNAIVKAKEHVRFDERNHSYVDDFGHAREAPPGTEQWRVYYEIENFNQVPELKRNELWESEQQRIRQFGFRFHYYSTPEKASYDKAQIGDRLEILYRYMGDQKEILGIRNLSHPDG